MKSKVYYLASSLMILFAVTMSAYSQGRPPTPPDQPVDLSKALEGTQFTVSLVYSETFKFIVNDLKANWVVAQADENLGKIVTEGVIRGGSSQVKWTLCFLLTQSDQGGTNVRVAMLRQNRRKGIFETRPWGETKLDKKETEKQVEYMKAALEKKASTK
ncbi:MAG TPA: hypothetical protein VE732_02835 [Nitrososphaera sp.]|jgi:hypothetical protein|nr:hypothetical protein [Nitrososphaera sp.]